MKLMLIAVAALGSILAGLVMYASRERRGRRKKLAVQNSTGIAPGEGLGPEQGKLGTHAMG